MTPYDESAVPYSDGELILALFQAREWPREWRRARPLPFLDLDEPQDAAEEPTP